jgi:hypothetical protein
MIMIIDSDALYLLEGNACSQTGGHFFMGWLPQDDASIKINGAFHFSMNVIRFIVASAAKAELGALFHNCQTGIIFCSILEDMGHVQPQTPVDCNNATAVGIANSMVKRQQSWSMEMRFSGLVTSVHRRCMHFIGTLDRIILQIIKASTTRACNAQLFAHGICMRLILHSFYQGQKRPAL